MSNKTVFVRANADSISVVGGAGLCDRLWPFRMIDAVRVELGFQSDAAAFVIMDTALTGLQNVDWLRTAQCWKGRVVRANGKIINSNDAAHLVCNILKDAIGIALDSEDQIYEEKFQREN